MSLHDVDKTNSNRITSILNSADDVQQRMAQGTSQVQNAGEEESDGLRTLERQIMAVQDGTNKAVFGFYGTANKFGFKVAEDGVDVLTASDDQLLFNSEQNVFKIVKTGTVSVDAVSPGSSTYTTVTHNLGYVPAAVAYADVDGIYAALPYTTINTSTGTVAGSIQYIITSSTIVFFSTSSSVGVGFTELDIRYYLLRETAN